MIKVQKLFKKTLFGVFALFGLIGLSTSILCVYTVDTHLSAEYESNSRDIAKTIADSSVDILLNRDLSALPIAHRSVRRDSGHQVYLHHQRGRRVSRPHLCAGHSRRNSRQRSV